MPPDGKLTDEQIAILEHWVEIGAPWPANDAAPADQARQLYEEFVTAARGLGVRVETGVFQADMAVTLLNDGPVTLIVESAMNTPSGNAG